MREKLEQENERKQQAREKLAESIRRAEEAKVDVTDMDSDAGIPDDTDDPDDSIEVSLLSDVTIDGKATDFIPITSYCLCLFYESI